MCLGSLSYPHTSYIRSLLYSTAEYLIYDFLKYTCPLSIYRHQTFVHPVQICYIISKFVVFISNISLYQYIYIVHLCLITTTTTHTHTQTNKHTHTHTHKQTTAISPNTTYFLIFTVCKKSLLVVLTK